MDQFKNILDSDDLEILKNKVRYNISLAHTIREKIKVIDELNIQISYEKSVEDNCESIEPILDLKSSEYEYYYENIKDIPIGTSLEELKKIIKDNLPSKNNSNYFNIILYIKYKVDEEILTYASLIEQCNSTQDKQLLNDIKVCIEYLKLKLSLIDKIDYEVQIKNEEIKYNNIVFLHSIVGNNYPISDLNSIDESYYDAINELYDSIKSNTFKGVKRFGSNDSNIFGVSEVRGNAVRIIFDRLSEDTYIILQILVKKTTKDYGYKNTISSRYSRYNKKEIIDKLNSESFIIQNKEEKEQLEKILCKRSKIK